jgi:hypothetical protein
MTLCLITITFAVALIGTTPEEIEAKIITSIALFDIFIILQLIYEYGRINKRKDWHYRELYLTNFQNLHPSEDLLPPNVWKSLFPASAKKHATKK